MAVGPRKGQVGDWFVVPLPEAGTVAVGHVVRATPAGIVLAYFFAPFNAPPHLDECLGIDPATAVTAIVCGAKALETGHWTILGSSELDPRAWPMPEFEKRLSDGAGRERLYAQTLEAGLIKASARREVSNSERGQRPLNVMFSDVGAANYVAHRVTTSAPRVGEQLWWHRPAAEPATPEQATSAVATPVEEHLVLLRASTGPVPHDDYEELIEDLAEAATLTGLGEFDGTLTGPDLLEIYLYGPDGEALADVVAEVAARHNLRAGAELQIRSGPPGAQTRIHPLG